MSMLFKFGKELFWTIFWVFIALIVGFFVLSWISNRQIPLLSTASTWVEQNASAK